MTPKHLARNGMPASDLLLGLLSNTWCYKQSAWQEADDGGQAAAC